MGFSFFAPLPPDTGLVVLAQNAQRLNGATDWTFTQKNKMDLSGRLPATD